MRQIAKHHFKCFVAATASGRNQEYLKDLGVDAAVDYTSQKVEEVFKDAPFDCVVDLIGGESWRLRACCHCQLSVACRLCTPSAQACTCVGSKSA